MRPSIFLLFLWSLTGGEIIVFFKGFLLWSLNINDYLYEIESSGLDCKWRQKQSRLIPQSQYWQWGMIACNELYLDIVICPQCPQCSVHTNLSNTSYQSQEGGGQGLTYIAIFWPLIWSILYHFIFWKYQLDIVVFEVTGQPSSVGIIIILKLVQVWLAGLGRDCGLIILDWRLTCQD